MITQNNELIIGKTEFNNVCIKYEINPEILENILKTLGIKIKFMEI